MTTLSKQRFRLGSLIWLSTHLETNLQHRHPNIGEIRPKRLVETPANGYRKLTYNCRNCFFESSHCQQWAKHRGSYITVSSANRKSFNALGNTLGTSIIESALPAQLTEVKGRTSQLPINYHCCCRLVPEITRGSFI